MIDTGDAALFERLRAGDGAALEPLMKRFASRVYRVAHRVTGNAPDAKKGTHLHIPRIGVADIPVGAAASLWVPDRAK